MAELMVERTQTITLTVDSFEWPKVPQSKIESKEVPDEPLEILIEQKIVSLPLPKEAEDPTERSNKLEQLRKAEEKPDKACEQLHKAQTQGLGTKSSAAPQKVAQATKAEAPERENTKLIPLFGLKKTQWPEPHLSLGTACNRLGSNECWKAIGPAKELFNLISKSIEDLLDARVEDLEEGEPVAGHILLFDMYMIGKSATTAQPTLLFTCQRPKPRRRAIKYIRESGILKGHPKILLAESSLPPLVSGTSYLKLLAGTDLNSFRTAPRTMPRRNATPIPVPEHTSKEPPLWIIAAVLVPVFIATVALVVFFIVTRRRKKHGTNEIYAKEDVKPPLLKMSTRPIGLMHSKKTSVLADGATMEQSHIQRLSSSPFQMTQRVSDFNITGPTPPRAKTHEVGGVLNTQYTNTQDSVPASTSPEMAQVEIHQLPAVESIFEGHNPSKDESFGVPILCSGTRKRATMGEIIHVNGNYYGLTAAHPFTALSTWSTYDEVPFNCQEIDAEFAFVSEDEEEVEVSISEVVITSQASMSSSDSEASLSRANTTSSTVSHTEVENTVTTAESNNYVLRFEKEDQNIGSVQKSSIIGRVETSSLSGIDLGLDWALIELWDQSFYDTRYLNRRSKIWTGNDMFCQAVSRANLGEPRRAIIVKSGYSGTIPGFLLPGSTAMKLTPRSKFQEVWTVQLEQSISSGDSGSFVVDAVSRDICGHIVAGAPGGCLAYIIPAFKVFEEIEKVLGGQVSSDQRPIDIRSSGYGKEMSSQENSEAVEMDVNYRIRFVERKRRRRGIRLKVKGRRIIF